ncbi:MAG: RNA-binding S4 domain-containing protein [Candidatus Omnitrophica bacterium]|nr:RNA-binding S4 domain-containing protein [Candidatus Omnitrophota bacterium]
MMVVAIEEEPIELYKLLKYSNLAQSGGEAKFVISEALVKVNGMVETQKRKKIVENDIVEFNSQKLRVARKIVK